MFVVVNIEHNWTLSQRLPDGMPISSKVSSNKIEYEESPPSPLYRLPLASQIRVTVPASIAQLVKYYNSCHNEDMRILAEAEEAVRDVMKRLECLVLASCIQDSNRVDPIRNGLKQQQKIIAKVTSQATILLSDNTRKSATEARISTIMLLRCSLHSIRIRALALLCEALDTNVLSTADHELLHLQMLWVESVQLFRHVVDSRTRKYSKKGAKEEVEDGRVLVDLHLENILRCLVLTLQRLDHIQDSGKPVQYSKLMEQSYLCILEDLKLVRSEDPYIIFTVSSIEEQVLDLQFANNVTESVSRNRNEVALDAGVSILSQVLRMNAPAHLAFMHSQFLELMGEIFDIENWYLGTKLIKLLGSAATSNYEACSMFIQFMNGLREFRSHWQWHFQAVLLLGSVACGSNSPRIKRLALEAGIIPLLNQSDSERESEYGYMVRGACIVVLTEIYQQFRSDAYGLLAREVMQLSLESETHPHILGLLALPKAKSPQENYVPRISFLFKHISIAFAETYVAIESDSKYMRNYLNVAEKNEKRHAKKNLKMMTSNLKGRIITSGNPLGLSTRNTNGKKHAVPRFSNLENLIMTVDDYHQNYKKLAFQHDSYPNILENALTTSAVAQLSPSFIATSSGITKTEHRPAKTGSINRRKMYHSSEKEQSTDPLDSAMAALGLNQGGPAQGAVKVPQAISIIVTGS